MASWPSTLPAPLIDGYGIEPVDQTVATDMEVGTQRVRRRSFAQVDTVRFAVNLSDAQMAVFRHWFYSSDGADGGAGWFTINIWVGRGGSEAIECRFKGTPKWDMTGNHRWIVAGQIEVRPYAASWWDYFAAAEIPSLDLDFAGGAYSYFDGLRTQTPSDPFASFITFTRSTTATYMGADGLLKTAAVNEPRIEYDAVTGECKGLLIEESRTNLLKYSGDIGNAASWGTANNVSIAPCETVAPDGSFNATTLTATADDAVLQQAPSVEVGTILTSSVWIRRRSGSGEIKLRAGELSTQVVSISDVWSRVYFTNTAKSTIGRMAICIGANGDSIDVWGAQLEVGSFPTSYIKTEASAVTRAADDASVTGANFSSWYRQDEGSFRSICKIDNGPSSVANVIFGVAVDSFSDTMYVSRASNTSNVIVSVRFGGSSEASYVVGQIVKNKSESLSVCYKTNDIAASFNGSQLYTDTSARIPTVNRLSLGAAPWGILGAKLNGHISRLTYWPKRLSNTKLQELSA